MSTTPLRTLLAGSLLSIVAAPAALAEGARIVDAPGLPPFSDLQDAVDAAVDGDTIVVAGGVYAGFTVQGKGLALVGVPGQTVSVEGTVTLLDVPAASRALLSGLEIAGLDGGDGLDPGLVVTNCDGHVRVEGCTIRGGEGGPGEFTFGSGSPGVVLQGCPRIGFAHSTLAGGDGGSGSELCFDCTGGDGGLGVRVNQSTPAIYQCAITGGRGGDNGFAGGDGAAALRLLNGRMFAAGSSFTGGRGGNGLDFIIAFAGDGGDGLFVDGGAQAELLDDTFAGGAGGVAPVFPRNNGAPGAPIGGAGVANLLVGSARDFQTFRMLFDDSTLQVSITGEPGDEVWLKTSPDPAFRFGSPAKGVHLVANVHLSLTPHGVIPATGNLLLQLEAPDLAAADRLIYLQGFGKSAGGETFLASPMHALVLDDAAGPDCNGNQKSDLADAILGTSADCGPNLVPDECDPDCDGNGSPDDCDLAAGTLVDCNGNGVPDVCDIGTGFSQDCNANGVPDSCDLASGASTDANGNGIPDECDPNTTWWVDAAAAAGGDGSAGAPFQTLVEGMSASIDGDQIMVRDGTYSGAGNRDVDFGGRSVVVRSENGPGACVIDLMNAGRAFIVSGPIGSVTGIEGFTIRNGSQSAGGAVSASYTQITIKDCVFENCGTSVSAGAVYVGSAAARIEDCVFSGNSADPSSSFAGFGGAVFFTGNQGPQVQSQVVRCRFEDNAARFGGAIHHAGTFAVSISHSVFLGNHAGRWGGAVTGSGDGPGLGVLRVDNCLFAGNTSDEDGGALCARPLVLNDPTEVHVTSSTFSGNSALAEGGAVAVQFASSTTLENCVLWANSASAGSELGLNDEGNTTWGIPALRVERCDVAGGQAAARQVGGSLVWAAGNLDLDPWFADADGPDDDPFTLGDNDYRPLAGSPVNDAGDNGLVPSDTNDVDGDANALEPTPLDLDLATRLVDDALAPDVGAGSAPLVDMGCYERP